MTIKFRGIIGTEGELTGDGRMIQPGALRFSTPVPLNFVREASGGHDGSVTVGQFTSIERVGDDIVGSGEFLDVDAEKMPQLAEDVATAIFLIQSGAAPGVSMDLSEVAAELRVAASLFEDEEWVPLEDREQDEDGRVTIFEVDPADEVMVFTDALIRAATLVSIPAFKNANLQVEGAEAEDLALAASGVTTYDHDQPGINIVLTAAAPREVDANFFNGINLTGPTALTVDGDGQVFGHIALWDTCHTGIPGACTTPPRDPSGSYRAFHQSRIQTTEGIEHVGVLTVGGGHADSRLGARAAVEHYDNVGTVWAYVRAYEDDFGIAVVGVLADDLDERTLATALAHPVSGDWRNLGSGLELVACCSVNTPGFPVLAASGGVQTSLVAASTVQRPPIAPRIPTADEIADAVLAKMQAKAEADEQAKIDAAIEALATEVQAVPVDSMYRRVNQ